MTVLPALLASAGQLGGPGPYPRLGRRRTAATESRLWSAVARAVVRRPLVWGGSAALALLVLALPALGMRLQDASVTDSLSRDVPAVDAAARMQRAFPGTPAPAWVAIWSTRGGTDAVDDPAVREAVDSLHGRAAASGGALHEPITSAAVDRALPELVPFASFGYDDTANEALTTLRKHTLPAALGHLDGVDYAVAGKTAITYDFTRQVTDRTPLASASCSPSPSSC